MRKINKKWLIGAAVLATLAVGGGLVYQNFSGGATGTVSEEELMSMPMSYVAAKEGTISSSTLFTGKVVAKEEQYVYYDATKGDIAQVLVKQGDVVKVGQNLIQYDTSELQSAVDQAQRAYNKVARAINDLRTNGSTVELSGNDTADSKSVAETQQSVNSQLADLQDQLADAQSALTKSQEALDEATEKSTVAGTVVEVNTDVSKSATATTQTVVHIVSQGNLQVTGELTEYDLANIKVGAAVNITSKVYPDKTWTGKISYISNYPTGEAGATTTTTGTTGAKYPFKVDITGTIGELKQGFAVNIEVVQDQKKILIPVSALVLEGGQNFVWAYQDGKVKKVEVTVGDADATNQEILSGLKAGQQVINYPLAGLEDGQKVEAYEEPITEDASY